MQAASVGSHAEPVCIVQDRRVFVERAIGLEGYMVATDRALGDANKD